MLLFYIDHHRNVRNHLMNLLQGIFLRFLIRILMDMRISSSFGRFCLDCSLGLLFLLHGVIMAECNLTLLNLCPIRLLHLILYQILLGGSLGWIPFGSVTFLMGFRVNKVKILSRCFAKAKTIFSFSLLLQIPVHYD